MTALPQYGKHVHPDETMRSVVIDRYGGRDVLRAAEVPRPVPRRDQVLVRNRFVGANPKDVIVRKGKFRLFTGNRFPLILGNDIAGEIVETGSRADLDVGTPVYGMINSMSGTAYAEYTAVDHASIARAPESIGLREAAAVPLAAQTALEALRDHGRLRAGQRVLINGASGGVGVFAVQIAKILGAHVTAVSSHRNLELVERLGADEVVDYTEILPASLPGPFHVVFDVFGNYRFDRMRHLLAERGTYVHTVPSVGLVKDVLRTALRSRRARMVVVRSRRASLDWLREQIDAGRLRVVLDGTFALEEAAEAHRRLETKRTRGKIVLAVDPPLDFETGEE